MMLIGDSSASELQVCAMLNFKWARSRTPTMVTDFHRALDRQVLLTERLRLIVVIITVSLLLGVLAILWFGTPEVLMRISQGRFDAVPLFAIYGPFLAYEVWSLQQIGQRLALNLDVPVGWRYLSAFIETSLPTAVLYFHVVWMGPTQALGFAAPFAYFVVIILSTLRLDFWLSTFTGTVAAVQLFATAMLHHPAEFSGDLPPDRGYHLIRSMLLVISGILAGAVGVQLRRQFEASIAAAGARDRVTNLFGQHVSPQVVEQLLATDTNAASETRHVAVMFVDIRAFTAAARLRAPHEVVTRLDGVFAVLVDVLDRHSGIVNKFLGDGFMALFGAPIADPQAAHHAVAAAREMLVAMEQNNIGSDWPMRIGIGVHLGSVVAGNVGSPRRKEYTVMGDTVNFAARLESLNKEHHSQLLISAAVRDALGEHGRDAVLLGEVPVRGYDAPQAIWQLA